MNEHAGRGPHENSLTGLSPWAERLALNCLWEPEPWPNASDAADEVLAGPPGVGSTTPHALCLPEGYVERYAYPLVIWLHDRNRDEKDIIHQLPAISERNYLGLAPRGPRATGTGYDWNLNDDETNAVVEDIQTLVSRLRSEYNVHPERLYLVGQGTGGTAALRLFLRRPDLFAGVANLDGEAPDMAHPLAAFRHLHGRRVLFSWTNPAESRIGRLIENGRLLYRAGLQVATRSYQSKGTSAVARMLRDVDHWIMDGINTAIRS